MLRWIPAVLIAASFALSAMLQSRLPSSVMIGVHRLLPPGFDVTAGSIPRAVAAFGLPTLALLVWALLFDAPVSRLGLAAGRLLFDAKKPRYELFAPTYRLIVLWVVCLLLSFHLALMSDALQWSVEPGRIVGITLGAGLLFVGNAMPRLRPNAVAGIRTARTMSDPVHWARVHRVFGAAVLACGCITIITSLVAARYSLATALGLLILASVFGVVVARPFAARQHS